MIRHKHLGGLVVILLIFAVLLTCFVMAGAENSAIPMAEASVPEYTEVFDKDTVMTINIEAEEKEFQAMLDTATEEEYIRCNVTVNGTTVYGAGIRPKGNSSLSMVASSQDTDRFSFKLEFDHYIENQTLMGLDKMVINNIQGDATYMKEYLSYDIMSGMGIPTPLFAYAEVTVNGEPWGFYLAFGGFQAGSASSAVNFPIDTPVSGVDLSDRPLIGKLLEVPEYKEQYHEYLRQIGDEYFNEEYYNNKVDKRFVLCQEISAKEIYGISKRWKERWKLH